MTSISLLQPRFRQLKTLRAMAIGLAIGFAVPAFADNLPEVQRLIKQGQYPQALDKVDAYLSSRPKDAQGRFLKGLIYTEMNKPAEAIGVFTKLSEDYPELPEPYNNLAVLYAQQKQYDKARTALEMAIRTHPSYAIAYENLGDVYAKLASQAYDKALQLDNSNSATQNKLALIRDLITTSGKGNVKPQPAVVAAAPIAAKPAVVPSATIVAATPGAAAAPAAPVVPATKPVVVAAAPAAAPAPAPAAAPTPAPAKDAAGSEEVVAALNAWADAWSRKDMRAYLGAYANSFKTPKGMSRKAWEQEREQRIAGKSGKISVSFDTPQITLNGSTATAKFRQHYKAPGLSSSTTKTLVFVRTGSKWLIKEENTR
ncbi:MAG: tetratricopeptide repeat protein [Gammaproteobacteria bacterium]|nr:tetratricopeptide repeat protein [Gammaproteobacteria bacterium]MBU1603427.1 tetratricopeptide repeat protein [Gammaproteobacteria bacterium]MBU2432947.1 tetratricopeptide repeat protein [Gammaproteobacteria bacterium]MBU2450190.1 tetratricopeptide repeat protein [Gammaproteobacteria bacterium]